VGTDRLVLARLTYRQALAEARVEPTPARWRRLVRCGTNLRAVIAERIAAAEAFATGRAPTPTRSPWKGARHRPS
jgi:hypothetical protein